MPHERKKRMIRKQNLKGKKKLDKYLVLSKRDFGEIDRKRQLAMKRASKIEYKNLREANSLHGVDFVKLVKSLRERFPGQRIEMLDEGAGKSSFAEELIQTTDREIGKDSVRVTKTDIIGDSGKNVIEATPEQLLHTFGPDRFHLVKSTFSGIHYTDPRMIGKGLENVLRILKSGGIGSILVSNPGELDSYEVEEQAKFWAKKHKNVTLRIRTFTLPLVGKGEEIIHSIYHEIELVKH